MNSKEQAREWDRADCEDALFAQLMDEMMEREGAQLLEENERLMRDPGAAVPEEADRRCVKAIRRSFARARRRRAGAAVFRAFSRMSLVAVICAAVFSAAYAASPGVRAETRSLLLETMLDDLSGIEDSLNRSLLQLGISGGAQEVYMESEAVTVAQDGYTFTFQPAIVCEDGEWKSVCTITIVADDEDAEVGFTLYKQYTAYGADGAVLNRTKGSLSSNAGSWTFSSGYPRNGAASVVYTYTFNNRTTKIATLELTFPD